ncbi:MAG: hypothetical protein NTV39_01660 [Candidatus Saccharibacteria bacterium]|nr:hypothetical protein [Candidatus Saccharibacteria bacterium]
MRHEQDLRDPITLPTSKLVREDNLDRLQDMGFIFGDFVEGSDEYVQYSTFPRGWSKVLSETGYPHKLWSLVDPSGNERVRASGGDFFKLHCATRFYLREVLTQGANAVTVWIIDQITGQPTYMSQLYHYPPCSDRNAKQWDKYGEVVFTPYGSALGSAYDEARSWLARFHPEYLNPCSYWT